MKPLRVLVVNQYFPPDTSATAEVFRDVVDSLRSGGHQIQVLCGRPSYLQQETRIRQLKNGDDRSVGIKRVRSTTFSRQKMVGRIANYLSFVFLASIRVLFIRRPDVVISGSDPPFSVWVALLAARGRPVVYSLQDLHPEFAIASNMIKRGIITRIWGATHDAGLRRCAMVVCLGTDMAERVVKKGVPSDRISIVYDGAPSANGSVDPQVVSALRGDSPFTVAHCGNLGGAGAWETLIEAARRLNGNARFLFVGDGFQAERIKSSGIRLVPFRPEHEFRSVMMAGDLQVVTLRLGMEGLVFPSKLYTAMSYGRPVLAVVPEECEVARIVEEWGCGILAQPDDPDDVVKKIEWAQAHPKALAEMSRRSLLAGEHFDRNRSLQNFVRLVELAAIANGRNR